VPAEVSGAAEANNRGGLLEASAKEDPAEDK